MTEPRTRTSKVANSTPPRKVATFDSLLKKPARRSDIVFKVPGDNNETEELVVVLQAIGSVAYDNLVAANPPTDKQRKENDASYNVDTFGPALISACSYEPKMTLEQATELYNSDNMSSGEMVALFLQCLKLCNAGVDVPFSVSA